MGKWAIRLLEKFWDGAGLPVRPVEGAIVGFKVGVDGAAVTSSFSTGDFSTDSFRPFGERGVKRSFMQDR